MMAMNGEPLGQVAEWRLNSGGVFMRASDDEGGKLARLADVRDWLMHRHEWPMERAAHEIVEKLRGAYRAGLVLFMGQKKAYARPLRPDDHMLSMEALRERGGLHGLDERLQGFAGVCNAIINGWLGEYAGYGGQFARIDAVCVRAADAALLWGWGAVNVGAVDKAAAPAPLSLVRSEPAQLSTPVSAPARKVPQKSQAPGWTGEVLAAKRAALKREDPTRRDLTKQLEALSGLSAREITRREKQARDSAAQALKPAKCIHGLAA